jgi:hypothetical protein
MECNLKLSRVPCQKKKIRLFLSHASEDIEHQALDRLTQDRSLYDTKTQSNFATAPS